MLCFFRESRARTRSSSRLIPGNLLRATSRAILHPVGDGEDTLRGRCCGGLERAARLGRLRCSVTSDQIAHLVAQEADTYYHERFHRIDYRSLRDAEQISPPGKWRQRRCLIRMNVLSPLLLFCSTPFGYLFLFNAHMHTHTRTRTRTHTHTLFLSAVLSIDL